MSERRQRRRNIPAAKQEVHGSGSKRKANSSSSISSSPAKKIRSLLLFILYIPLIAIINPTTIPNIYHSLFPKPCHGICNLTSSSTSEEKNISCNTPIDPSRLIFLRIPKTGSTSLSSLFESKSNIKSTRVIDLGEIDNLVPSLPIPLNERGRGHGTNKIIPQGYYDPSPKAVQNQLLKFYKQSSSTVLNSPFRGRQRLMFDGHFRYYDYYNRGYKLLPPLSTFKERLPSFIKQLYNIKRPPSSIDELKEDNNEYGIPTITLVRSPYKRLSSMYYYDRNAARNPYWRKEFVKQRGNQTLNECLLDPTCIKTNELQRWCNIQTEMLCGVEPECMLEYPLSEKALDTAKRNVNEMLFVGITERMDESVQVLEKILPTYLQGASTSKLPRENVGDYSNNSQRQGEAFSDEALLVLEEICSLDIQLYEYVDKLLTQRMQDSCAK